MASERVTARRVALGALAAVMALIVTIALTALAPSRALASHQQISMLEEDNHLFADPAQTIAELRHLGVEMIRVPVRWSWTAPDPKSFHKPNFDATDPNAYPAVNWAPIDAAVLDATAAGMQVLLDPTAFAPLWAQGSGATSKRYGGKYDVNYAWEPNAAEFGQFVQAVGTRYSGSFVPAGQTAPLPRVSDWEIYNEPNFGEDLAPQAIDGSSVMDSPSMYRSLVDNAWSALQATGHSTDTIILGSLLADGYYSPPTRKWPQGLPGTYGDMMPLIFIRELYCLNSHYHHYLGSAARQRNCPTTNAGYSGFKSQHPALFRAAGFSDHPYDLPKELPPTEAASSSPNWAEFPQIPHMESVLDKIQRIYGSSRHFQIWNTEFGYITCPPNCEWRWVRASTAAYYINWAEYLSWRNPRLMDTMQYLLYDPNPTVGQQEKGGFSSGLVLFDGVPKAEYYAYRMPIYLPHTKARRRHELEVWGDVRPAPYAVADGDGPQFVQIQFARGSGNGWTTLKTLPVTDPHGYFDTWMTFPASGRVRLKWTYPANDPALKSSMVVNSNGTIYSRLVSVTIH